RTWSSISTSRWKPAQSAAPGPMARSGDCRPAWNGLRVDRPLDEAPARGPDPLHVAVVSGLDDKTAIRYANAARQILKTTAEQYTDQPGQVVAGASTKDREDVSRVDQGNRQRQPEPVPASALDEWTHDLAQAVGELWRREEDHRRVHDPVALPVRWHAADDDL